MIGIVVGVLLAGAGLFAVSQVSQNLIYEKDEATTLGLPQGEIVPDVALRPLTQLEIAKRLEIESVDELVEQTQIFASRVSAGYLPTGWDEECAEKYSSALCRVLDDYFEMHSKIFSSSRRRRGRRSALSLKNINRLQGESFNVTLGRLPDWSFSKLKTYADAALKSKNCPRSFSLALAHKMETHFGNVQKAEDYANRLHEHGLDCVEKSDSWAEYTFIRGALLRFVWGDYAKAAEWLEKALEADQQREDYRTLYWLGRSYEELKKPNKAEEYFSRLEKTYPVSWHGILSRTRRGRSPFEYISSRPIYPDLYGSADKVIDLRHLWFQSLLELDNKGDSVKRYGEFFVRSLNGNLEPGFLQYLARSFDRNAFHRLQIFTLNQLYVAQPEKITLESLRLMFPKPFFEEMEKNSPDLDTAILLGLARQESGFDPVALSPANARGLLQILPSTARWLSRRTQKDDLYDYARNIEIGSLYLMRLIRYFDGSVEKALGAYNAGQGNLRKWERRYARAESETQLLLDLFPFRETRDYVPSILRNAFWYHKLFPEVSESFDPGVISSSLLLEALGRTEVKASKN